MKKNIASFLFLALFQFSFAHEKTKITIKDSKSGMPVQEAVVVANDYEGNTVIAVSDANGNLFLSLTENMVFKISALGYQSVEVSSKNLKENTEVLLVATAIRLEDITLSNNAKKQTFASISGIDIHLRPINNSQEVLRMIPGLFIGQHAGGGKAEQIFLRGFDIDHGTDIAITVDGMPVNMVSHAHGQGYADLHFVIPEMIDKVNFDKGTYFADKGNFTTAGFVDFKTKNYLEKSFVKFEGGQFNTGRLVTGLNILNPKTDNGQSLIFGSEATFSDNFFDYKQKFQRFNGLLKYTVPFRNSVLNVSASGFKSLWFASGQIPDRAVKSGQIGWFGAIDPNEGGQTSRVNVNAILTNYFDNGATLKNQFFFTHYEFELYSNFTFFLEDPINGDEIKQKEHRNIIGYNGSYITDGHLGKIDIDTEVGVNVRYDYVDDIELSHTASRQTIYSIMYGDVYETNTGVYAMQTYKITPKLNITLGLREDIFTNRYIDYMTNTDESASSLFFSPKLNFTYQANDKIKIYFYNGRGFHSNDTRVAVAQKGREVLPPAYGNDLGFIWKPMNNLLFQSALWHLFLEQEFVYVGDAGIVEPSGQTRRMGIDFSARYEFAENWFFDANLNFANPKAIEEPKGEDYIPLAPTFTSIGGITYRKSKGLNGSLRYRYMADRPANEDNSIVAKGYFVSDLALNYTAKKWEAGLTAQNLFNTKWKETQFDTESRLQNETSPVSEIHFTPGTPFFAKASLTFFF